MKTFKKIIFLMYCGMIFKNSFLNTSTFRVSSSFNNFIENLLRETLAPGCAIAIVHNDLVVFKKTYGVESLETKKPINEETIFSIASLTKSFTATIIAMLVQEGKLQWDDTLVTYLPEFKFADEDILLRLTIRDVLSHKTGLDNYQGDYLWYKSFYNAEDIIRRLQFLKPLHAPQKEFGYQNVLYIVLGKIIEVIEKKPFAEVIKEKLFTPLYMHSSTALYPKNRKASPHIELNNAVVAIPWDNLENVVPAAGISSTLNDMIYWLLFKLNSSKFEEPLAIKKSIFNEMHTPQTIIKQEGIWADFFPEEVKNVSYGLGWFIQEYGGVKVINHGGFANGMSSLMMLIPEKKLGAVILINKDESSVPYIFMYSFLDQVLGIIGKDWGKKFINKPIKNEVELPFFDSGLLSSYDDYCGIYHTPLYGEVRVTKSDTGLRMQCINIQGRLHWLKENTFSFIPDLPYLEKSTVCFKLNTHQKIDSLTIDLFLPHEQQFMKQI